MSNDEFGDKTEQPTQRRRTEAREKGNVARSTDLTAAGLMLAAATAVLLLGIPTAKALAEVMHTSLSGPAWLTIAPTTVIDQFWSVLKLLAGSLVPLLLLLTAAALAFNLVQVGFLIAPEAVQPDIARLNPITGARRLFSLQAIMRLGTSLAKLTVVVALAATAIHAYLPSFLPLVAAQPPQILFSIEQSLVKVGYTLAGALVLLALVDFVFQKWKHQQDLRMSKQEVREEMKNMEGDPKIRQRRRDAHRKLAQARELHAVRNADVVITDPTDIAVALQYEPEIMPAPKVLAKGTGDVAQRIRLLAAEHDIPIIERKDLARSLYRDVKAGNFIPADMYEVFVEIMSYVYRLARSTPRHDRRSAPV